MIIDVHAHLTDDLDRRLADDARAGIAATVLLSTRVHPERARTIDQVRAEYAGLQRTVAGADGAGAAFTPGLTELLAALDAHPGRVLGMAAAPLDLPPATLLPFVDRQLSRRDVVGIGELVPVPGRVETIRPVVRLADDHGGLPVLVHGFAPHTEDDLHGYAAVARAHPGVPIVIGAFGGLHAMTAVDLALAVPNLWLDLSSALQAFVVRAAAHELPDRCLFGSNTPYGVPAAALATVEHAVTDPGVRAAVLGGNAERLLAPRN